MRKGRMFFSVIAFLCFLSSIALANGLNLNSLGTKALAMGGAFVGLADDFSAIYWNPAGIVQFDKKYFGFYGTDIIPSSTYKMTMEPVTIVDAKTVRKQYLSGLVAYYYPVSEKVVAGIGIYVPSGLGAKWDGEHFTRISMDEKYNWRSKIGFVTIAPALAFKVNEMISVGVALNINYGTIDLNMHAGSETLGVDIGQYSEELTGWGYGATLGVLVKPSEMLSIGATFRTASTVKFSGEAEISRLAILSLSPESPLYGASINTKSDIDRDVTWPMWLAGGVAFKPMENLTLTGDLQWTQWSKIDIMKTKFIDPIWKELMDQTGVDERPMHWNNALQIRLGAEYRINTIAIRGGYYFDPSPAPDRTMNILLPSYDFNVVTVGFGYALDSLQFDFGIEYLMGKERSVPVDKAASDPDWESAMPGTYNMKIIVPNISISYKF